MHRFITEMGTRVLSGGAVTEDEAVALAQGRGADVLLLGAWASKIREAFTGDRVDLCAIVNARSGNCSEDCAFCQSSYHTASAPVYRLMDEETIVARAREMQRAGAHRFDIVTSGLGITEHDPDFQRILQILRRIRKETGMQLCACLGTLTEAAVRILAEAGVTRYNHNLETVESMFPEIVSTHTYAERVRTVRLVKAAGMEVCCGGIIGMGETMAQRIEFAFTPKELDVDSVPSNVLNPIPGTPLEGNERLHPMEVLKTFALFRFILPDKNIRYAGGREVNLRDLQALGFMSGLNGMLVGSYLTTGGRAVESDPRMLEDLGMER